MPWGAPPTRTTAASAAAALRRLYSSRESTQEVFGTDASTDSPAPGWRTLANATPLAGVFEGAAAVAAPGGARREYVDSICSRNHPRGPSSGSLSSRRFFAVSFLGLKALGFAPQAGLRLFGLGVAIGGLPVARDRDVEARGIVRRAAKAVGAGRPDRRVRTASGGSAKIVPPRRAAIHVTPGGLRPVRGRGDPSRAIHSWRQCIDP